MQALLARLEMSAFVDCWVSGQVPCGPLICLLTQFFAGNASKTSTGDQPKTGGETEVGGLLTNLILTSNDRLNPPRSRTLQA